MQCTTKQSKGFFLTYSCNKAFDIHENACFIPKNRSFVSSEYFAGGRRQKANRCFLATV